MARDFLATTAFAKATVVKKNTKTTKAMKPSGVPWIGVIPEGWEVMRLKGVLARPLQYGASESGIGYDEALPRYIRITDITLDGKLKDEGALSLAEESASDYILQDQDILLARSGATVGKAFLYEEQMGRAAFAGYLIRATVDVAKALPRFVYYTTLGCGYDDWRNSIAVSATIQNIGADKYNNYSLPIPPIEEQRAIADYLDEKCGAIDAAIAEAKKGIEEYKAWKKSLIFEAVTGKRRVGIFNVEKQSCREAEKMRPSGIPWIGEIPEGWEVRRLKFVFDEITDGSHFSPETTEDGYPYVTATDVRGIGIDFTKTRRISNKDYETLVASGCKIKKGDVLLVKDGATTGRTGLMVDNVNCVGLSSVAMLRTAQNNNRFLMYLLDSEVIQKQILLAMAGSAMPRITITKINEFYGLLPPLPEQQAIADYLDDKCAAIDAMVAEKEALIADLEAYKKSLIYEVVTGKKEPEAAASGTGQEVA